MRLNGAEQKMAKYEGNCFICNKTAGRTALKNHVLKEHSEGGEKCYLIRAEGAYQGSPHWLFFSVSLTAKLDDVDDFLREIWCECCGHLSSFSTRYSELPMTTKISMLDVGYSLLYEYDFGSTTEILVTVVEKIKRPKQQEKVQLLARNVMTAEVCSTCAKPAEYVDAGPWEGDDFACELCLDEKNTGDIHWMPITNSPRSGVCGYDGGLDVWEFDPKGDNKTPERESVALPKPDNLIQLDSFNPQFRFLDDDFEYDFDDSDDDLMLETIDEIRDSGRLEEYLEACAALPPLDPDAVRMLVETEDFDLLEELSLFVVHVFEQVSQLTDEEKEGYDLSEIYDAYEMMVELINRLSTFIGEGLGLENFTIPKMTKQSSKVADNVINLFGESNQPTAEEKWNYLSQEIKQKILNNVFCVKCGVSSIKEGFTINQESIGIVLRGQCCKCDSPVIRAIEEK